MKSTVSLGCDFLPPPPGSSSVQADRVTERFFKNTLSCRAGDEGEWDAGPLSGSRSEREGVARRGGARAIASARQDLYPARVWRSGSSFTSNGFSIGRREAMKIARVNPPDSAGCDQSSGNSSCHGWVTGT
jgi:hypothetical protein